MTRNIVDIIKEQAMTEPTPTEKAQIVVMFTYGATNVFRFDNLKKAEKAYKALIDAWHKDEERLFDVGGDMFIGRIDITGINSICLVDHAKRNKFVPIP